MTHQNDLVESCTRDLSMTGRYKNDYPNHSATLPILQSKPGFLKDFLTRTPKFVCEITWLQQEYAGLNPWPKPILLSSTFLPIPLFILQNHLVGVFENVNRVEFHEKDYDKILSVVSREKETIMVRKLVSAYQSCDNIQLVISA